jgi:hypothetical protein
MCGLSCQETDTVREQRASAAASFLGLVPYLPQACQVHPRLAALRAVGLPALWDLALLFSFFWGICADKADISMGHLGDLGWTALMFMPAWALNLPPSCMLMALL